MTPTASTFFTLYPAGMEPAQAHSMSMSRCVFSVCVNDRGGAGRLTYEGPDET